MKVANADLAEWLRIWTSAPINGAEDEHRMQRLVAAQELAKLYKPIDVNFVYRAFALDLRSINTWDDLDQFLYADFPESFSNSIVGVQNYLNSGGAADDNQHNVIFAVRIARSDAMFYVPHLVEQLHDPAQFKDICHQDEIVAHPGTLKKAVQLGDAWTIGYTDQGSSKIVRIKARRTNLVFT